jgi:hypothetical protein
MVTWVTENGAVRGCAGGIELFSVTWRTVRTDPKWLMVTRLPGLQHNHWAHDDQDWLKREADVILTKWLLRVLGWPTQHLPKSADS